MSSYMAKLASLKAPPAGLKPPRRPFSHPSDKIGLDDPGMHPTFTAARPFGNPGSEGVPSRTRDTGAPQTSIGQLKFGSGPQSGGASGLAAPGPSEATQPLPSKIRDSTASPLSTYADTPEAAPPPQPNAGAQSEPGAAGLTGPGPSRRSTSPPRSAEQNAADPAPSAGHQPARLTPTVRTSPGTDHSTPSPEGKDAHDDPSSAPSLPLSPPAPSQPGWWEWASGRPLELGQLHPSAATHLPHADPATGARPRYPLVRGEEDHEGSAGFTAPRQGADISENVSPTPALPIGPAPRPAEKPEKQTPLLVIGAIEVTVVPQPASIPAPAPPLPPAVTVIRPTHSQPRQPALAWYGLAQT
jgi:hypothetical protein